MRITSLHLLPQSPQTQLPNHLKFSKVLALLQFFTQQIIAALETFYIKQYFHEFDPHVGDTACQIRAYYLTLLASNIKSADMFPVYRKLALLKNVLAKIEQDIPFYQKKDTQRQKYSDYTTLEQFIKNNQYCVELNKKELFLTQARMLTCYKTDYRNEPCIDYEKLVAALNISLGLLVWLKNSGRPFTLGELNNLVKGTANFVDYLKTVLESAVIADNLIAIDPVAFMNLNNFIQKSEKEQSGVKSSLTSCLTLWDDPYVVAATSKSDFDIRQMRQQPMTIYLGIPANQLERLAPLMNLFVQQFIGLLTEELPQPDEPYRVLAILDEFCNLGKMQRLRKGFSYLAGYHVHLMPVIQNVAEFYALYGKDESDTFFQNTEYKIMYRQNATTDKMFVSQLLGDRTVQVKTKSHHNSRNSNSTSTGEQFIKRPLLSPDEVGCFPKDKAILQLGGEPPIKFKRCIYYTETLFTERLLPPTDIPTITP